MCDTLVKVQPDGVFFAKNSDRDANEPQLIEWHEARKNTDSKLKCTYIEVDQVKEQFATLISRPLWMWGAEIGTNEHSVTIGNEAVFTKQKVPNIGLTGMDLIRLALERSSTAKQAVDVILKLIERYGQGGAGSKNNPNFKYFSSFLIADKSEAYVLETTAKESEFEKIESGVRSISNGLTIPSLARKYSDFLYTTVNRCRIRQPRFQDNLRDKSELLSFMNALRDHGSGRTEPHYHWVNGAMDSICMHAGGLLAGSQTTASWVSKLSPNETEHWVTGTAAPCTGLFKPVFVNKPLKQVSRKTFSALEYWMEHEKIHKAIVGNFSTNSIAFAKERDALEKEWFLNRPTTEDAFAKGAELDAKFLASLQNADIDFRPWYVKRHWQSFKSRV